MNIRRNIALALAGAAIITATVVPATSAAEPKTIASVLERRQRFRHELVRLRHPRHRGERRVSAAKPGSPLAAAADPATAFTVFAPNDRAFQALVASLTGKWYGTEARVTDGADQGAWGRPRSTRSRRWCSTTSTPVAGSTSRPRRRSAVSRSRAHSAPTIKIKYYSWINLLVLGDKDTNAVNPFVVNSKRNIDAGNSIIHGISFVLRPMDLPPLAR